MRADADNDESKSGDMGWTDSVHWTLVRLDPEDEIPFPRWEKSEVYNSIKSENLLDEKNDKLK